jgi:hypothetical protein
MNTRNRESYTWMPPQSNERKQTSTTMEEQPSRNGMHLDAMLSQRPKLNKLNWLNFALFVLNFLFTYGVGDRGWLGHGTTAELSAKFQVRNVVSEFKALGSHYY